MDIDEEDERDEAKSDCITNTKPAMELPEMMGKREYLKPHPQQSGFFWPDGNSCERKNTIIDFNHRY